MINLRIGGVPEHFNLPWRLAIEEGLFRAEGIHLHWEDMTGGTGQMIRGLEHKSIDIAVLLTEGITKSVLDGLRSKILSVYVKTPLHWGIHVPFNHNFNAISDLEGSTFAISRSGSGSHLMAYVMADQQGWKLDDLKFNTIGDVYGGLWALENNEAQIFLWEKFTTQPFVEQNKCAYLGDVVTPWPCFCVAANDDVLLENKEALLKVIEIVNKRALELKNDPDAIDMIAWRYKLKRENVEKWLAQTDWNYDGELNMEDFQKTVDYLLKLNLINSEQAVDFQEKIFLN